MSWDCYLRNSINVVAFVHVRPGEISEADSSDESFIEINLTSNILVTQE